MNNYKLLTCICSETLRRAWIIHCTNSPHGDVDRDTSIEARQRGVVLAAVYEQAVVVLQEKVVRYWAHVERSSPADVQRVCALYCADLARRSRNWNDNVIIDVLQTQTQITNYIISHSHFLVCFTITTTTINVNRCLCYKYATKAYFLIHETQIKTYKSCYNL